jgi:hypothetical protein
MWVSGPDINFGLTFTSMPCCLQHARHNIIKLNDERKKNIRLITDVNRIVITTCSYFSRLCIRGRVLRRIFGAKMDEILGGWRKLYNEQLYNLYSSSNITRMIKSRRMRCAVHVEGMWEKRNTYRILVGKPEGKTPLGRPWHKWEDNNKVPFR